MQNDLDQKASKADLEELERQLQERMNDMFSKMREMYPEKEAIKKKFLGVEKNVSNLFWLKHMFLTLPSLYVDQEPLRPSHEADQQSTTRRRRHVHQEVRWPSQLCLMRERHCQPDRSASRLPRLEEIAIQRAF